MKPEPETEWTKTGSTNLLSCAKTVEPTTDQDAVWGAQTCVGPGNRVSDEI